MMKKMIIGITALAVLAAGSLTAFFIAKNKQDKAAEESAALAADYALFSFDPDSINKVTFNLQDGVYVTELSEDGEWEITNSDEFDIKHSYVQNVCTYMSTLTAEKDYGESDDEKKELYGLVNPGTITATDGTNEYTVYIGDQSPAGDLYYIMTGNKSKIYSIDSLYGSVLKTSRTMMKDTSLVPFNDSEIAEIELIRDGKTIYELTFDEKSQMWKLPDAYNKLNIDHTVISTMISVMTRTEVQTFLDEQLDDYSKYGFDKPVAELIVTGTDGLVRKLLFSYLEEEAPTFAYVLFEESGQVATFYSGDVDFIHYNPKNFFSEYLCNINIASIDGFDYTYNGTTDAFKVDMTKNIVTMNNSSVSGYGENAATAFTNFYNSLMYLSIDDIDVSASPEKTEPTLAITYHLKDNGGDRLIELIKADDESFYAFIDGNYTGAVVSVEEISGKNTITYFYDELLKTIGL